MESKLKLKNGETLKTINHRSKGPLAEMDIYTYEIINQAGEVVGTVTYTDHTAIKGFIRTQTVEQKDNAGKVIVDKTW